MFLDAHYSIGKKALELGNFKLSVSEKDAFYSGLVFSDIGKFVFDRKIKIKSDEKNFIKKMANCAKSSEETWYVMGSYLHEFQDSKVKKILKNIFKTCTSNYVNYILRCGILECYFLNKNNEYIYNKNVESFDLDNIFKYLKFLENSSLVKRVKEKFEDNLKTRICDLYSKIKKINLNLPYALLKKTYKTFDLGLTFKNLDEQAGNLVGACVVATSFVLRKNKDYSDIFLRIQKETENLCEDSVKIVERKLRIGI